tara:strand:+ start:1360 stop:3147 length:1788 start_codon:yes stop_codon:yes gene_type:complete
MKNKPIKYTSRDFESIRRDLENFAKRYYPDSYKDFNRASFGSLMLDTVSYVGDILSFYLDYQVNESFLETAVEYSNVGRLARQLGYRPQTSPASYGKLTFYVEVPASTTGLGPNSALVPVLQAGSTFSSNGGGFYTTLEDVDFAKQNNQVVVGTADPATGTPLTYVIRAMATAVSGRATRQQITIGDFVRFRRVPLPTNNISDVLSVIDSAGNEYFEVDNLSQNTVYKSIRNTTATRSTVSNILKAVPVARRYTVETENGETFLQFGYGSDITELSNPVVDPSDVVLQLNGRNYITEIDFDPTKLISTDKFGIAPVNTTLTISYRFNTTSDVNAAVDTIVRIESPDFKFASQGSISLTQRQTIIASLEVSNDEPFVGSVSLPSSEEIKQRAFGYFATQNRAVTSRDYQALCYGMPERFGMLKRIAVSKDSAEFKKNINMYVISEDGTGNLTVANSTLKSNLKTWISQYKMISDTIDILDASIINFGIEYEILTDMESNRFDIINKCTDALAAKFADKFDIGESILITDIYKQIQRVPGVVDVTSVEISLKSGGRYSDSGYSFQTALTSDGRQILGERNTIFELKYPNIDIKGSIK